MSLREAYKELRAIVGDEYVSDDPAVCEAYGRGGYGREMYDTERRRPAFVVLPGNSKQVQDIVKCCVMHKLPYIPVSTFYIGFCAPERPNMVTVDLKRMDSLEIDPKNMYAVVEPYVTYAQLQSEASKYGLYTNAPLCGSEVSVLANHAGQGFGQLGHRAGLANRKVLGVEWVLPNGEILKIGSSFNDSSGYFWGEGPGPDLRGLLRGWFGHFGGLGILTKMAVKLIPMPSAGVPEPWGLTPSTGYDLPPESYQFYNVLYPSMDALVNGMYEVGKAEIGGVCMSMPVLWRYIRKAESRDQFWITWQADLEKLKKTPVHTLRVTIIGYSSPEQTEYEKCVLEDIAKETGGIVKTASRYSAAETFKPGASVEAYLPTGLFISQKLCCDSIDHALKITETGCAVKREKYVPPFLDDLDCRYINSYDLGHFGYCEVVSFYGEDGVEAAARYELESIRDDINNKAYSGAQWTHLHDLIGEGDGKYHLLMQKIAEAFDPHQLSNRGLVGPRGRFQNKKIAEQVWKG